MSEPTIHDVAEQVHALSPADKLRLAAELIDVGKVGLARTILNQVSGELALLVVSQQRPGRPV